MTLLASKESNAVTELISLFGTTTISNGCVKHYFEASGTFTTSALIESEMK